MSYDPESYRALVRSLPRPPPPACAFRGCTDVKIKFSPLFCAMHEMQWIANGHPPSGKLDSQQIGAAILWAKEYNIQTLSTDL